MRKYKAGAGSFHLVENPYAEGSLRRQAVPSGSNIYVAMRDSGQGLTHGVVGAC
jgi:hypothetical protein